MTKEERIKFFQGMVTEYINGVVSYDILTAHLRMPREPQDTYRPWNLEEVPVGALIKWNKFGITSPVRQRGFDTCFIAGICQNRVIPSVNRSIGICWDMQFLLTYMLHSMDHGKTWFPCGVKL